MLPGIVVAPQESFSGLVGFVVSDADEHSARAVLAVRRALMQPWGVVHGGVFATIAETLASWATATAVVPAGAAAMGLSNSTSFLLGPVFHYDPVKNLDFEFELLYQGTKTDRPTNLVVGTPWDGQANGFAARFEVTRSF